VIHPEIYRALAEQHAAELRARAHHRQLVRLLRRSRRERRARHARRERPSDPAQAAKPPPAPRPDGRTTTNQGKRGHPMRTIINAVSAALRPKPEAVSDRRLKNNITPVKTTK